MGRRAIAIVRVSRVKGREGDSFASPDEQADRIRAACQRDGLELIEPILEELDVSGGADLIDRPGLGPAVDAVEAGEADVIVAAYFDRFFRSIKTQVEVLERVERAGGRVLAVDVGTVSGESAGQWLSSTMLGIVSEYQRRSGSERTREAIVRAISRGAPPGPTPKGYVRLRGGRIEPDPSTAQVIAEAFRMRAGGASARVVREHLSEHGISLSISGVRKMLTSRAVLGEIHFGGFAPNLTAYPPIVDRLTWQAAQRVKASPGRHVRSGRLLARLGVLLCGTCGSRMVASTARGSRSVSGGGKTYATYQCQQDDCERRATVMAHVAEDEVVAAVKLHAADTEGRASAQAEARAVIAARDRAQVALDAEIRVLAIVGDEPAAMERLAASLAERDAKQAAVDDLGGASLGGLVITAADIDRSTTDEMRTLIRACIRRATVTPGRGRDRVRVERFGQESASDAVHDPPTLD